MKNKKVLLGLSGGVDSSIALYILLKKGYDVDCLFMRNWDSEINNDLLGNPNNLSDICPQEIDYNDAIKVAKRFNTNLIRKDFVKEYWDDVFKYFIDEYKKNRTPNPDIICNNKIKFKAFLDYAIKNNYDYIATGHYAKLKNNNLYISKDKFKDQTYFLSQLTKEQLSKVIFPLSNIKKEKVRKIAQRLNLENKSKKDSTGICFIGERNFREFLKNYLIENPGDIKTLDGKNLGRHIGLNFYTIGQRKDLNIKNLKDYPGPYYVVGKNTTDNILYVENKNNLDYLYSNIAILKDCIFRENIKKSKCLIRFRHQQKLIPGKIINIDNEYKIEYKKSKAVTPGQLAAVYFKNKCVGAGFIESVYYNNIKRSY